MRGSETTKVQARRPIRESHFWQAYNESRYAILFYALLLTLFVIPAATTIGLPAFVLKLLLAASLFAAVMPNATPNSRYLFLAAAIALVVASLVTEAGYLPVNSGLALALGGLVGLLAAAGALRFTVKSRVVNSETVYAALSTYLLAGLFFGQIYWAIENIRPGSLTGPDPVTEVVTIYYSFVTLATLGYGDYLPRTDIARGIATFEVIGGQLFLAVMVARLIGAFGSAEDDC
jgi:hypothetical protein